MNASGSLLQRGHAPSGPMSTKGTCSGYASTQLLAFCVQVIAHDGALSTAGLRVVCVTGKLSIAGRPATYF